MRANVTRVSILGAMLLLGAGLAHADAIAIGNGAFNSNATGSLGQDPNLVGNGSDISVYLNGNSSSITNQFLLILLVPNDTTNLFASNPLGTITTYPNYPSTTGQHAGTSAFASSGFGLGTGTATFVAGGFWGSFTPTAGAKLSDFLGPALSDSYNGTNFTGFDSSVSVTATGFGVYAFTVTSGAVAKGGLVDVTIPGGVAKGSIFDAIDDNGDTPAFTNAGGTTVGASVDVPVPETSSLLLLSAALSGLAVVSGVRQRETA
jgi:hypothetical protein